MEKNKERKENTTKKILIRIIVTIVAIILLLKYVIGIYYVTDLDMFPAFRDGDLLITYKLDNYYSKDVVVYEVEGKQKLGRISGVTGDTINIVENGYYEINGGIPYETIFYPTNTKSDLVTYPYIVKEDEVFIMGDMRETADDSRMYGAISKNKIKGKVVLLLFRGRGF